MKELPVHPTGPCSSCSNNEKFRSRQRIKRLIEAGQMTWIHPSTARSSPTTLQIRLEATLDLTTTHHRRPHTGEDSDRVPQRSYDPEAAKRHFRLHLIRFSVARPVVFTIFVLYVRDRLKTYRNPPAPSLDLYAGGRLALGGPCSLLRISAVGNQENRSRPETYTRQ
ncbi:unnamed protein product [Pleuronectes platessa]|uniref:Uncharacterized protein n=1 Tax=Pleuronectes platessa TaxID=8262 RepID=A0A9N7U890_PLEPL|nr:unnamed protein product [Pleuronectes platessa]